MSRMKDLYKKEAVPALMKKFSYSNVHMIPKLEKIVVNCCTKDAVSNSKVVDLISAELAAITGQKRLLQEQKAQ